MLKLIHLYLARCPEFPEGSSKHGYEIVAPLDAAGRIDLGDWNLNREKCKVRRFWNGEANRAGRLVHRAGGPHGATWVIDYDARSTSDDEPGYRLDLHRLAEGEYVTIRDANDTPRTFQVAHVRGLHSRPSERSRA
ncbi:hypothetical protein [Rhodoligotrophos ferricapiens]|uniref:hypothetical protein n=1 Tax=Rhodoligotrophos ferricapiens TaxID=3069264 RepID=UPI00315CC834